MPVTDPRNERVASVVLFAGAAVWGLYWLPLRALAGMGIEGTWGVVYFNAFRLVILVPVLIWGRTRMIARPGPVLFIGALTRLGMGFYSTAIVMAPVVRMTMEFYLTPVWSTIIGVCQPFGFLVEQFGRHGGVTHFTAGDFDRSHLQRLLVDPPFRQIFHLPAKQRMPILRQTRRF